MTNMHKRKHRMICFCRVIIVGLFLNGWAMAATTPSVDTGFMHEEDFMLHDTAFTGKRDPFTVSDRMYQRAGGLPSGGLGGQGFVPYLGQSTIPKMRVRRFVKNGGKEGMALLEVEGDDTVHFVRKGDEIGIQNQAARGGNSVVLKIIHVDAKKVEVQSGSLKQIFIVQ